MSNKLTESDMLYLVRQINERVASFNGPIESHGKTSWEKLGAMLRERLTMMRQKECTPCDPAGLVEAVEKICKRADELGLVPPTDSYGDGFRAAYREIRITLGQHLRKD